MVTPERTFSSTWLNLDDKWYLCGSDIGNGGGCWQWIDQGLIDAVDNFFSLRKTILEAGDVKVDGPSAKQMLGIDADCFQITATDPDPEDGEMCFSKDDVLLSLDLQSPGLKAHIAATELSTDVREDDFALPHPVVEGPP
jgi:hypothetical protein